MARALAQAPAPDLALGRYRPLRPLGSGASGSVWLARDEQTGLDVALKIVPREGKAGLRAEREAEAASRLRHPTCLRAYAFGREHGHVYIAYEYAPGCTFRDALRSKELGDADLIEACAQLSEGLAHAHGRGVVHRDVKPANVLLTDDPGVSVRLLDFGLAAFAEAETLTAVGDVPGTLAYISPERLSGEQGTGAGDVWAVGVMLWEALAGRHPFWRPSLMETGRAIEEGAPSLRTARPDLPEPLLDAVDRALATDPRKRPTAAKLAALLRDARPRRGPKSAHNRLVLAPARMAPAAVAGAVAGLTATLLPFWPPGFALGFAALATLLGFLRPRLGLGAALAVGFLPVGNLSLGLALAYAAAVVAWLAATAGPSPVQRGLVTATGVVVLA
ncbi:MAG: serine/threonine protein kinase, partial [Actinobacteria bacterium]|nr:serine/threonine protein kinase [Actinomycetota bacterium]